MAWSVPYRAPAFHPPMRAPDEWEEAGTPLLLWPIPWDPATVTFLNPDPSLETGADFTSETV